MQSLEKEPNSAASSVKIAAAFLHPTGTAVADAAERDAASASTLFDGGLGARACIGSERRDSTVPHVNVAFEARSSSAAFWSSSQLFSRPRHWAARRSSSTEGTSTSGKSFHAPTARNEATASENPDGSTGFKSEPREVRGACA